MMAQEPLWLWFTLPELRFPMITDIYRRPIHPEVEEYMRRYVTDAQDWEQVDDEDCWGANYTEPTTEIKNKIESILYSWGGGHPEEQQAKRKQPNPEREKLSVPHASRDPKFLQDRVLENENIFEIIMNPPEMGFVRIFKKPEFWDTTAGPIKAVTTQGIAKIHLSSGPRSLDGAQWHLLKHTLVNSETSTLGINLQNELTRQLRLDKDKKHRSIAWNFFWTVKEVFPSHQIPRGYSPHHPTLLQKRGKRQSKNLGRRNIGH